jgi:hypothetical protein
MEPLAVESAFKCGVPNAIILVDGELASVERYLEVRESEAIHTARVACWSPRDSTFSVMGSGIPFYEVLTETFVAQITSRLDEVRRAQRAFAARHQGFSDDLRELGLVHLRDDGTEIVLGVDSNGWTASAKRGWMVHSCSVGGGASDARADTAPGCSFDMTRKVALPAAQP